jgi:excisionase family DNA binding protein
MENQLSYTLDEAVKLTGIGKTRLYEELNAGRLKAVKIGRRTLVPHKSLQEWLQGLPSYPVTM